MSRTTNVLPIVACFVVLTAVVFTINHNGDERRPMRSDHPLDRSVGEVQPVAQSKADHTQGYALDLHESLRSLPSAERHVHLALKMPVTLTLEDVPLHEAVRRLCEQVNVEFTIDQEDLKDNGIDSEERVSESFNDLPLEQAFGRIFEVYGLVAVPKGNVLEVSTIYGVPERKVARNYDISLLLQQTHGDPNPIIEMLGTCTDEFWQFGEEPQPLIENGRLLIVTSELIHRDIRQILDSLKAIVDGRLQFCRLSNMSRNDVRVFKALSKTISVNHRGKSFRNVIDDLGQKLNIPARFDVEALAEEGVSLDQQINLVATNESGYAVLDRLFVAHPNLSFTITNGALIITTAAMVEDPSSGGIAVFNIADIPIAHFDVHDPNETTWALQSVLMTASFGVHWDAIDGLVGDMRTPIRGALVVRTAQRIHFDIARALAELRAKLNRMARQTPLRDEIDVRLYRVDDFVLGDLIETIPNLVAPKSWTSDGGVGLIEQINGMLIIKQTTANHEAINDLLFTIREQRRKMRREDSSRFLSWGNSWSFRQILRPIPKTDSKSQQTMNSIQTSTQPYHQRPLAWWDVDFSERFIAQSAEESRIHAALGKTVTATFKDVPLRDFVRQLGTAANIRIAIDESELKQAKINPEAPITGDFKAIPLEDILTNTVHNYGLTYAIKSGVLWFAESRNKWRTQVGRFYDIRPLLEHTNGDSAAIVDFVEDWSESVFHDADVISLEDCGILFVHESEGTQREIEHLLDQLLLAADHSRDQAHTNHRIAESSPANLNVLRRLREERTFRYVDISLTDALRDMERQLGVPVRIDEESLREAGIKPDDRKIDEIFQKQSVARTLVRMLWNELGFVVEDGAIVVTTEQMVNWKTKTVVYNIDGIPTRQFRTNKKGNAGKDGLDGLRHMIQTEIGGAWEDADRAPGRVRAPFPGVLVVGQTRAVHAELSRVLSRLRIETNRTVPQPHDVLTKSYCAENFVVQELVDVIPKFIAPDSWQDSSNRTIKAVDEFLVVRHTVVIHKEIDRFLRDLWWTISDSGFSRPRGGAGFFQIGGIPGTPPSRNSSYGGCSDAIIP